LNKQDSNDVSEQVRKQDEQAGLQSNGKMPFLEPIVSAPEDVLEATTFFQAPTVDTTTV